MSSRLLCLASFALTLFARSNVEMARIFDEDQKDRANWFTLTHSERKAVTKRDAMRRQRVGDIIRGGLLNTGEDFEKAAFIFQHGIKPLDFIMAHALAPHLHWNHLAALGSPPLLSTAIFTARASRRSSAPSSTTDRGSTDSFYPIPYA